MADYCDFKKAEQNTVDQNMDGSTLTDVEMSILSI